MPPGVGFLTKVKKPSTALFRPEVATESQSSYISFWIIAAPRRQYWPILTALSRKPPARQKGLETRSFALYFPRPARKVEGGWNSCRNSTVIPLFGDSSTKRQATTAINSLERDRSAACRGSGSVYLILKGRLVGPCPCKGLPWQARAQGRDPLRDPLTGSLTGLLVLGSR